MSSEVGRSKAGVLAGTEVALVVEDTQKHFLLGLLGSLPQLDLVDLAASEEGFVADLAIVVVVDSVVEDSVAIEEGLGEEVGLDTKVVEVLEAAEEVGTAVVLLLQMRLPVQEVEADPASEALVDSVDPRVARTELRLRLRLSTVVGMAIGAMAHMTTGPHTAVVVGDLTVTGTADQVGSRAVIANQFDREMVGSRTARGQEMVTVDMVADETMTTEVGRDIMTETGTTTPANGGTSRRLCNHGLLGGLFHLVHLLLFLLSSLRVRKCCRLLTTAARNRLGPRHCNHPTTRSIFRFQLESLW